MSKNQTSKERLTILAEDLVELYWEYLGTIDQFTESSFHGFIYWLKRGRPEQ